MQLRAMTGQDFSKVETVAAALPEWFTSGGLASIRKDIHFQSGIVAENGGQIEGFVTYFVNQGTATIGWMGILPTYHRKGVRTGPARGIQMMHLSTS